MNTHTGGGFFAGLTRRTAASHHRFYGAQRCLSHWPRSVAGFSKYPVRRRGPVPRNPDRSRSGRPAKHADHEPCRGDWPLLAQSVRSLQRWGTSLRRPLSAAFWADCSAVRTTTRPDGVNGGPVSGGCDHDCEPPIGPMAAHTGIGLSEGCRHQLCKRHLMDFKPRATFGQPTCRPDQRRSEGACPVQSSPAPQLRWRTPPRSAVVSRPEQFQPQSYRPRGGRSDR